MIFDLTKWSTRPLPSAHLLQGQSVRLEKFEYSLHADAIKHALRKSLTLPKDPVFPLDLLLDDPHSSSGFSWRSGESTEESVVYAVVGLSSGRAYGLAVYHSIVTVYGVAAVEVIAPAESDDRRPSFAEAVHLMVDYAFELGYRRLEWECDSLDERACETALQLGFTYEGIHRQNRVLLGSRSCDDCYFAILDRDYNKLPNTNARWFSELSAGTLASNGNSKSFSGCVEDELSSPSRPSTVQRHAILATPWKPLKRPEAKSFYGRHVRLEAVDPAKHLGDLLDAFNDPTLYQHDPYGPFEDRKTLLIHLEKQAANPRCVFYAVVDINTDKAEGTIGIGDFNYWLRMALRQYAALRTEFPCDDPQR